MHSWKKKLVVSQLALACTLAITSQANATTYDTWTYVDYAALLRNGSIILSPKSGYGHI